MSDPNLDRKAFEGFIDKLSMLHAGTTTHTVLQHVLDEIKSGVFDARIVQKLRREEHEKHMDELVEKQGSYSHTFEHRRLGTLSFEYESWLVRRHWRYDILGTSVCARDEVGDAQTGMLYRPDCELCENNFWGVQGLTSALEMAYLHWIEVHLAEELHG